MNPESSLPAGEAVGEKSAADREYERKLDRDLRIMRVVLPVLAAVAGALIIALTAYIIVAKL